MALLLIALAAAGACGKEDRKNNRHDVEPAAPAGAPLPGVYTSLVFIEPGAADAPVDVHAAGGYINLNLRDDSGVEGKLVIPPGIGSNYDGTDVSFTGTWRRAGQNIIVDGTGQFFDDAEWQMKNGFLVTERSGRGRLEIRLQRVH